MSSYVKENAVKDSQILFGTLNTIDALTKPWTGEEM